MEFKKKTKVSTEIPTASMPDIVFMLLLFFMVTTVFRQFSGLPVELPRAKRIEKLEAKKNVTNIYANVQGEISIDDKLVRVKDIALLMYQKRKANPKLIVSLKLDKNVKMGIVTDIQQQLREADALRVNYCSKYGE
ncbi:biopolymer transporter ExbD [candidate division KSB1 bacterium]|nr:MAG: biopolymer transporter ExbD [candidate division KSB1 bacterium]